jgi:hypothetical protein
MAGAALLGWAALAQAQWIWVNEKGIKQLSDQPPPANVPPSRILKAPPGQMPDLRKELNRPAAETAAPAPDTAEPKLKARPTLAEQSADFNKRRIESAEKEQKASQDAKQAAAKADNCLKSRNNLAALESGQRMAEYNAQGERTIMDDTLRAKRLKETQAMAAQSCN